MEKDGPVQVTSQCKPAQLCWSVPTPAGPGVSSWQEVAAGTTHSEGSLQSLWALRVMGTSLSEDPAMMLVVKD